VPEVVDAALLLLAAIAAVSFVAMHSALTQLETSPADGHVPCAWLFLPLLLLLIM